MSGDRNLLGFSTRSPLSLLSPVPAYVCIWVYSCHRPLSEARVTLVQGVTLVTQPNRYRGGFQSREQNGWRPRCGRPLLFATKLSFADEKRCGDAAGTPDGSATLPGGGSILSGPGGALTAWCSSRENARASENPRKSKGCFEMMKSARKRGRPNRAAASSQALADVDVMAVDPKTVLRQIAADQSAPASARVMAARALLADTKPAADETGDDATTRLAIKLLQGGRR